MNTTADNNKRIAKNTLLLYFRMLLTMTVSLYTSRVVLNALGVEDYGIYNVVGGVVATFSVLSGSLSSAISRFITFELGKNDINELKKIFSSALTIQIGLALIIIILAETIGLWFLNNKLIIPLERIEAANWVYQFSIITFTINLISIPYNATIIAHERMSAFAYISLLEVMGKLIVAFYIAKTSMDKLIIYGLMLTITAIVIRLIYSYYCKNHFKECYYHFTFNKPLLKKMFGFAGWNFIGSSSAILRDQGGSIIINLFCGPIVNTSRGIALQVSHAIEGFVSNFMTALKPQIIKSYATENHDYMMTLIIQGARLAFYMLLILSLPILMNTEYVINLWLGVIPEHAVEFTQLTIIFVMSESISHPLITAVQATGNISRYQLIVGGLQMLNLPVSYYLLHKGCIPEIVFIVAIIISQCCLVSRLWILRYLIKLDINKYIRNVYLNICLVGIVSFILSFITINREYDTLYYFIINSSITILLTFITIYFIGCTKQERLIIKYKLITLFHIKK